MKPIYQIKQDFLNAIKDGKLHNEKHQYKQDIGNWSFDGVKELLNINRYFRRMLVGELTPKDLSEFGLGDKKFQRPKSFITEALWTIEELKLCKKELQHFIRLKAIIENELLYGNYQKVRQLLADSFVSIGYSVWSLEIYLLTYCLEKDYTSAINFLTNINEKTENASGFIRYLLYWIYKRSVPNVSPVKYDYNLLSFEKRNKTSFDEDKYRYLLFRLNYFEHPYFEDMSSFPIMESLNSVYDRYLTLCNLINSYFSFGSNEEKLCAIEIGDVLFRFFGDRKQSGYYILKNKKTPPHYLKEQFINILDLYYKGNYEEVQTECHSFLMSDTIDLDIIKIYCRSLLFLKIDYEPIGNANSPLNKLSLSIYNLFKGDLAETENIKRLHKNLYDISIAVDLDYFLRKEQTGKDEHLELKIINSKYFDPAFVNILANDDDKIKYLNWGLHEQPSSIAISYQRGRILKNVENFDVVSYIKGVDIAKILYENKDYVNCIEKMNLILEDNDDCAPIVQTATQFIFDSLFALERYKDAYNLYIDYYIKSPTIVSKTNTNGLVEYYANKKFKGERLSLRYLLFILINCDRPTDKSFLLEKYLRYLDLNYPSELAESEDIIWTVDLELIFYHLIADDIIRHLPIITSTLDLIKEKEKLLNIICKKANLLQDVFETEKLRVEQELDAYKASKNDDESKIYANVPALIKYEGENIRPLFEQLETLYKVTESSNRFFVVRDSIEDVVSLSTLEHPVDMTDNILAEISLQIFDAIKIPFLKSKFGIGTYLSTRIRHGVFEGEIRSELEKNHLALYVENGDYVDDLYWQREYNLSPEDNFKLMAGLKDLSMTIDNTINHFKREIIQIRISPEEKGYIDFSNIPEENIFQGVISSYTSAISSKSQFETFIKNLINYMWGLVERCLAKIRSEFDKDTFTNISKKLLSLNNLSMLQTNNSFSRDFKQIVNNANIDLEHRRVKVQHWFNTQDVRIENYKLSDLINLSWDTCVRYKPSRIVKLTVNNPHNLFLLGNTRIHLSDVFRTIFSNMITYCKKDFMAEFNLDVNLTAENLLVLTFKNQIDHDEDELNRKIETLFYSHEKLQKEGGTGLIKIQKIIKYDLGCEENSIKAFALDGNFTTLVTINLDNLTC